MVKKSLRTYQLYKQNLKIWFLFLLVSLLTACTQKPMPKPEQVSSIAPVSSWTQQATPERIDDPNIPNCEPLDLEPIKPEEIINIDDVVQNCKYETGHILYSDIGAWSNFPVIIDLWKWNITTQDSSIKDEPPLCEYWEEKYYPLKENESDIINFIKKYKIQENPYFNSINLHGELDERSVHRYFNCKESRLCKKLIDISYGANEKHHFFRVDTQGEYLIVDNKKIYHNESAKAYIMVSRTDLSPKGGIACYIGCHCGIRRIVFLSSSYAHLYCGRWPRCLCKLSHYGSLLCYMGAFQPRKRRYM